MTTISQLTPVGSGLNLDDQFIVRTIRDSNVPVKSATPADILRLLSGRTTQLSWNESTDTYSSTGNFLDVQSRMRRCVLADNGSVAYYLDADDSTKKAGDWLRIVESQALSADYTGTMSETTNANLRLGLYPWTAGTYYQGQRVIYNNQIWECIAASTSATPAAGSVSATLTGADGQVMVEIPVFTVNYSYASNTHSWQVRRGSVQSDGFVVHPAFVRANGSIRSYLYIGAYQVTGTSPATTVSGASNRVSMTRATQRAASVARGSGWHQWSQYDLAAVQLLMILEFQSMNSQRKLGNGAQEGNVYAVNTGLSNSQGNKSQNAYTVGGANTDYMSYRGLENLYGRAWQWTDGINVNDRVVYATNVYANFADDTSTNYTTIGTVPSASGNYQTTLIQNSGLFIPSGIGGSSTTHTGDGLWTNTGWRVASAGGNAYNGSLAGAFSLYAYSASSYAGGYLSGRLSYGAA